MNIYWLQQSTSIYMCYLPAMLPSSFAMNMTSLVMAKWCQQRYHAALLLMGIMAIVGWPFALVAHIVPFLITIRCIIVKKNQGKQNKTDPSVKHEKELSTQWPIVFWRECANVLQADDAEDTRLPTVYAKAPVTMRFDLELNVPFRLREIIIAAVLLVTYVLVRHGIVFSIRPPAHKKANTLAVPLI